MLQISKPKSDKQQFIYTMDKKVADCLIKYGFTLLSDNNGNYVFINDKPLTFADEDEEKQKEVLSKIAYTNVLCF